MNVVWSRSRDGQIKISSDWSLPFALPPLKDSLGFERRLALIFLLLVICRLRHLALIVNTDQHILSVSVCPSLALFLPLPLNTWWFFKSQTHMLTHIETRKRSKSGFSPVRNVFLADRDHSIALCCFDIGPPPLRFACWEQIWLMVAELSFTWLYKNNVWVTDFMAWIHSLIVVPCFL